MITLITGTPGAGKTLYALSEIVSRLAADRPLFVDGIPDLAIKHFSPSGQLEQADEKAISQGEGTRECYDDWLPVGSVLVVDECQRVWRPRGTASKVPAGVSAMEKHRHKGHDLILITQHPSLLDANVRRLVGRHIHVRRVFGWNRAMLYEWDSATEPSKTTLAIRRSWPYPKKAYALYKSAEAHTKRGNRVPFALFLAGIAAIALPVAGWYAFNRTANKWMGNDAASGQTAGTELATASGLAAGGASYLPAVPERILEALAPTDDQNHLSAPIYAAVVPPVVAPQVLGCIASARSCACYSQQQTPIWMPEEQCRDRAAGRYYDPYYQASASQEYREPANSQNPPLVKENPEIL